MSEIHIVKATSFADPADIAAFRRAKAKGWSDQQAFRVGDNGIGFWEDSTEEGSGPCCALPPEMWEQLDPVHPHHGAHLAKVKVTHENREVVCLLKDTMPHLANITNGAGIDLNPDACHAFGLSIPAEARVAWQFV